MSLIFEALQRLECERAGTDSPPPSVAAEFLRHAVYAGVSKRGTAPKGPNDEGLRLLAVDELYPRAAGSLLPGDGLSQADLRGPHGDPQEPPTPPSGPALAGSTKEYPVKVPSGVQRAGGVFRAVLSFVERVFPVPADSAALTPHHHASAAPPLPAAADLAPIEASLTELKTQHRELRDRALEQNVSLKRVEDRLGMVREATDRNTREQEELIQELKGAGKKINLAALAVLGLLAISVALSAVLYLQVLKGLH